MVNALMPLERPLLGRYYSAAFFSITIFRYATSRRTADLVTRHRVAITA